MSKKTSNTKQHGAEASQEWHPYTVWQQKIRDAEPKQDAADPAATGSWRADAVWQNLIKD